MFDGSPSAVFDYRTWRPQFPSLIGPLEHGCDGFAGKAATSHFENGMLCEYQRANRIRPHAFERGFTVVARTMFVLPPFV